MNMIAAILQACTGRQCLVNVRNVRLFLVSARGQSKAQIAKGMTKHKLLLAMDSRCMLKS